MLHRRFRGIVLALLGASCAAALVACTPPLPPDVKAALAESQVACVDGAQEASVPPGFAGAMDAVGLALTSVCPGQSMTEVDGDASLAVAAQAPTADEIAAVQRVCPSSTVVVTPAFSYGVALAVNLIGLAGIVLTPDAIAGVLDGSITAWDDPRITASNDGFDLTGLPPVTLLSTTTDSASVTAMTTWLASVPAAGWTGGVTATIAAGEQMPSAGETGEQALVDTLVATDGAAAVLPAFVAVANGIPVAATVIDDAVLAPDDGQLLKIGAGAAVVESETADALVVGPGIGGVPNTDSFDAAAAKVVLADGQPLLGWPVMATAHLVVCDDPLALSSAQYVVRLAGQGSLETFGVTPLPELLRIRTFVPLRVQVTVPGDDPSA